MSASSALCIGTLGGEFVATASAQDRVISATSISIVPQTNVGSSYVRAQRVGHSALFVNRDGKRLKEFSYNPKAGVYQANDMMLLADHVSQSEVDQQGIDFGSSQLLDMAFQPSRNMIWVLLRDTGNKQRLVTLTFDKERGTVAWARHTFGGTYSDSGATRPTYITGVTVIPNASGTNDDVWIACYRTVNGATFYSIEKIGPDFDKQSLNDTSPNADDKPWFSDCAKVVTLGTPGKVFAGFDHLKGQTVSVLADGKAHPTLTVDTSGQITLLYNATNIIAGLPYHGRVELLPVEAGAVLGTAQGAVQRVDQVTLRFYNTVQCKVGSKDSDLEHVKLPYLNEVMGKAITPYTGIKRVNLPGGFTDDFSMVLTHDLPYPMNIVSITLRGSTNES
jgi:hypothetical protein